MNFQSTLVLCLQIVSIFTAPLQLQLQQPIQPFQQSIQPFQQPMQSIQQPIESYQQSMELYQQPMETYQIPMEPFQQQMSMQISQQALLQEQMLALQQLQALQMLNTVHSPSMLYLPQPMIVVLPNPSTDENTEENGNLEIANENISTDNHYKHTETEYVDENLESVIVEAEPTVKVNKLGQGPMRAILLVPNGRFSIGEFISAIPWLPFEINVPDSISWAYNGISNGIAGIISIIGQRLPFRPRPQAGSMLKPKDSNLNMFLKQLPINKRNPMVPVFVLPLGGMMLPFETTLPEQM